MKYLNFGLNSIVIDPDNRGKDKSNNKAVITTDHTNKGIRSKVINVDRILITVVIKFTAPKIGETQAKWREKIAKSSDAPPWAIPEDRGG